MTISQHCSSPPVCLLRQFYIIIPTYHLDITCSSISCNSLFVTFICSAHAIRMSGFSSVASGKVFRYVIMPSSSWFNRIGWLKNNIAVPTRKKILKLRSTSQISQIWHTVAVGIEGKYRKSVWNQPSAKSPTLSSWCSKWSARTGSLIWINLSKTLQHVLRHRSSGQYMCCRLNVVKRQSITR